MKLKFIIPATAAALVASTAAYADDQDNRRNNRNNQASSAETRGSGEVNVDRRRARANVQTSGRATGPGSNSASSTVDAYGEVTRDGGYADIYGNSTAEARERRPRRDRNPD